MEGCQISWGILFPTSTFQEVLVPLLFLHRSSLLILWSEQNLRSITCECFLLHIHAKLLDTSRTRAACRARMWRQSGIIDATDWRRLTLCCRHSLLCESSLKCPRVCHSTGGESQFQCDVESAVSLGECKWCFAIWAINAKRTRREKRSCCC